MARPIDADALDSTVLDGGVDADGNLQFALRRRA
jgi:hypothetical protein